MTRTHTFIDKKGNEISSDSFRTRGIHDIKDGFKESGQNLEKLNSLFEIGELRLLAN